MTKWKYIGCDIKNLPKDIHENDLSSTQLKEILKSIDIIEGEIEAYDVKSIAALLLEDGIYPLKLHPVIGKDTKVDKLKKLIKKIKK